MRAMIKVKQALCWKCKYLFQSLSVEAACLIDCTTTDCMCMHFIVLVKRSQVYMHKYILTENINCFGLSPLSPLSIIWFSSVNKSNYKWSLNSGENKLYTFQFQPWKFYKIVWHHLEIPTRSKTKTHGNSTWVFKYPCGGNSFSYPPPPPPLFGFFCSPMPMGWWEVCNTSSSWFSWLD